MTSEIAEPSPEQRLSRTERQLFFIVGAGRSGTTLLQTMIASHPEAILPNETKFYTVLRSRMRRRCGPITDRASLERALEYALALWWIKDLELDPEAVRTLTMAGAPSDHTIFVAILCAFAEKHGVERVGEKSPGHLWHVDHLADRFPNARFIQMVRDPRAVSLSSINVRTNLRATPRSVEKPARKWAGSIDQRERLGRMLPPERYHTVRYEDLVTDPERELRSVCEFLSLNFDERMLDHHRRDVQGFGDRQRGHMENTLKPVFTSSTEKWRRELSRSQIALIEHICGDRLTHMGYEPTGERVRFPAARIALGRADLFARKLVHKLKHPRQHEPETDDDD